MKNRLEQLSQWLKHENIDFALITSTENIFYLSKYYSNPHERIIALGVFQNDEPFLICPKMEMADAKSAGWDFELLGYSDIENPWEFIRNAIAKRTTTINTIAIEKEQLSIERGEMLQKLYPNIAFRSIEAILNQLRLIKDEAEISILKEAARLADFGVEIGTQAIKEGKSELEIVATIEFELKKKGVRDMSFATMVLTGSKTASPHGTPSVDEVQKGDLVLFDLGVIFEGYCSDITRTVAFDHINEEQKTIYETVLKAQKSAIRACKPGIEIGSIDKTARDIIAEAGYGDYFTHRIGHGLGIGIHEFPSMNATNTDTLQPGMVFTIEPGIYVPTTGGVRIEDDLLITESGVESLTKFPKELMIIK
ncbi:M24 family metallopeptidase [Calidifontibacillus oryziterrae]|uniref:M24 family metallopeptidase n=1 Tax=Calidifontibacillus oryziterrae TaxID=1191699 RepID=UPI0002F93045|nr:Xaa-Pro peptidase family protein [Calidifontibacillus oryziterrae]